MRILRSPTTSWVIPMSDADREDAVTVEFRCRDNAGPIPNTVEANPGEVEAVCAICDAWGLVTLTGNHRLHTAVYDPDGPPLRCHVCAETAGDSDE